MKYLLIIFSFITFSYSESNFNGNCIDSFYTTSNIIHYYRSDTPNVLRIVKTEERYYSNLTIFTENQNKFTYDSSLNICVPVETDSNTLLMMSLSGLVCGTLIASIILHRFT